ncbi:protein of unknown function [Flavobacterium resistens]|uniref:DUF4270 family protein n=1 Tax=Flavobacterium resistens TaxID=443612 RepID=A0A521E7Z8_9FLAO|nr:DUF4270 domain-containing protein [Flavobacterium resistens]MRX69179.1 DUF4270 family protein [Flavobacterium resistens]SMO79290.1 protein of unknown function [Flavobacterium resistens]
MYNTSFIKKILVAATVVFLYSCDRDFNAIGDDLIGDNHFDLTPEKYDVLAYNQEVTPIESNGLAINALGIYDNPVLGTTTGSYVTQVALSEYAPTIGEGAVIDSVYLSVPYFSHVVSTDADGKRTFELDSVFGPADGKIDLSIYESKVAMRNSFFDNGTQLPQLYYTSANDNADFDGNIGAKLNNSSSKSQNTEFFFNKAEITDRTIDANGKVVLTKVAPEMRLMLDKAFFMDKILNAPAEKLSSANVFQDYFRGLYFKVARSGANPANLALINFATAGKIVIKYKAKTAITTDPDTTTEDKSITINLTGATASLQQDAKNANYANAIADANINRTEGDDRLYIKGGQGSAAVIELFDKKDLIGYNKKGELVNKPNGVSDVLDELRLAYRTKKGLVNEANLVFNIDTEKMGVKGSGNVQADEPKRVYLYDLTNNIPLIDYSDGTSGALTGDPKATKYIFGGIINIDEATKRGNYYKVRITNHIRNLIKDTTTVNVKLGLVVTEDIGVITSNRLKNKVKIGTNPDVYFTAAPRGSVMGPLGTILYGGKSSVPDDKRLKLEIYYTKPN